MKGDSETIIAEEVPASCRFSLIKEDNRTESAVVVDGEDIVVDDNRGSILGMGRFDEDSGGGGEVVVHFFFFLNGGRWEVVPDDVNADDDRGKNFESALSAVTSIFCFLRGIVVVAEVVAVQLLLLVVEVFIVVVAIGFLGMEKEEDDDAVMWCVFILTPPAPPPFDDVNVPVVVGVLSGR